jgi:acetyltransferase-like isoleucine patch superfamily enzyme
MGDLILLWTRRERAGPLSRRWMKLWAKRMLLLPALLAIITRRARLRRRGATIGDFSVISPADIDGRLQHLVIGTFSFVGRAHIAVHEAVTIGNYVVISDYVTILTGTHSINDPEWGLVASPVAIEDYAWVAQGAMILPGVTIGKGAVVGAGSVVARSVKPFAIVAGNPARELARKRTSDLRYIPVSNLAPFRAWLGTKTLRADETVDLSDSKQ